MKRYSVFAIAREAMRQHTGWTRAWRDAAPKKKYDVIIVGAGGHGLATAYYLGKNYGITNVAILEKGWLGGGNTGRNTTIIRSNYLQDPSAAIYEKARSLYETMSQDLNYNVMFSPRGVMMLAQTQHEVRGYQRTAHANALQGGGLGLCAGLFRHGHGRDPAMRGDSRAPRGGAGRWRRYQSRVD